MQLEMTIGEYMELCDWHDSLSHQLQCLAEKFTPNSKWYLRPDMPPGVIFQAHCTECYVAEDWYVPIELNKDGTLSMQQYDGRSGVPLYIVGNIPPYVLHPVDEH